MSVYFYELDTSDGRHSQTRGIPVGTGPPVTATRKDYCTKPGTGDREVVLSH